MDARVTRAVFVAGLCLLGFLALAYGSVALPSVQAIDASIDAAVTALRTKPLLAVFLWITALGAGATLLAVMLTATGLLWRGADRAFLRPLWLIYLGTEATVWGTKFLLGRERPVFLEIASASSPSFPSAHTAGAAAVYGFLAYILVSGANRGAPAPVPIVAMAAFTIAAVALSRVVLGVHFFSDVLGGLAVAGLWLCLGAILRPEDKRQIASNFRSGT